jgi:predicted transcriptional regulator
VVTEALAKRVTKLEAAFDNNTSVFSDTMKMLETRLNVVQDVLSMLHEEGHGLVTVNGKVDFNYYTQRYLQRLVQLEEKPTETTTPSVIATPDDDSPTIFGG